VDGLSPPSIAECGLIRAFQSARVFLGTNVIENVMVAAIALPRAEGTLRRRASGNGICPASASSMGKQRRTTTLGIVRRAA
jgi:ABC-type branched-subunit amino acid transport system ATPase component